MKKLKEYKEFEEFLNDFKNFNEKAKYFKIDMKGNVFIKAPSYILEYGYMYIVKKFEEVEELFSTEDIYLKKEKQVKRHSNMSLEKLKESFFRAIFNRDFIHSLSLANELIRRDKKIFFEILYLNAKLSDDENRLVKVYLFEKIIEDIGINIPMLRNLIAYICSSKEGYGNKKKIDKLYAYIFKIKFGEDLKVNLKKMNKNNEIILRFLEEK